MARSAVQQAQRQVDRLHVLGERAHRDAVHARLGDLAHRGELDAPGGLELGAVARDRHRLAQARQR